jgi:hypothetical protein
MWLSDLKAIVTTDFGEDFMVYQASCSFEGEFKAPQLDR